MRIAYHSARACVARTREAEIFAGRLACDGTSRFKNPRHHSGIKLRDITFKQRRTVHHRDACYADVVLDRDLLAAQQAFSTGMDIRLPVPGAVRIFRCRRPVSRRSRRNRRQGGRDQFVKPAVRGQRSFEGLLKGRNFVTRENETKIRSKVIDLLQCRKANCHASPTSCLLEDKRKKPSAARKGPEWHQCRCYQMVAWAYVAERNFRGRHSDIIGCARTLSQCTHSRTKLLCLSVANLVNATPAPFLCMG